MMYGVNMEWWWKEYLPAFVAESNRIEGILRPPTDTELLAHDTIVRVGDLQVADVSQFVCAVQPDAVLRDQPGLNVSVGGHIAPQGGPDLVVALSALLTRASKHEYSPWRLHCDYETLHPYTDGNGRSGRALWLREMHRSADQTWTLGFLHAFYYQTLQSYRA